MAYPYHITGLTFGTIFGGGKAIVYFTSIGLIARIGYC